MTSVLATHAAKILFVYIMVCAGLSDLVTMKIRTGLVLILLFGYALLAPLAGFAALEIVLAGIIGAIILLIGRLCASRRWIRADDTKLAAVTALWLGFAYTPAFLIYSAIFSGTLGFALWQLRSHLPVLPPFLDRRWIIRLHAGEYGVPYGVPMAAAGLVVFPQTPWMTPFDFLF